MSKDSLVKIGFGAGPHGIRGEVELRLFNPNPEESVLEEGQKIWLFPASEKSRLDSNGEQWKIIKLRFGNKVIAFFEGIKDRTHIESLLPFEIHLEREAFPEPEEGEVYLVDLVDLPVFSPEGEKLGKLESFSDNGMQYLFNIRLETGELMTLPYVDAFFPEINLEEKKIVMILPEYTE